MVPQPIRRNTIQVPATSDGPEEGIASVHKRNTVRSRGVERVVPALGIIVIDVLAPDLLEVALRGGDVHRVVEVAPAFARADVDDHEAVAALLRRVGDVDDAGARGGDVGPEIDAEIVEVGVGVGGRRGQDDG